MQQTTRPQRMSSNLSAVDQTMTSDDTIAVVLLLLHAELIASVGLQHVVLSEGSVIQKQRKTLTSSKLATLVLSVDTLLSTTKKSSLSGLLQTSSERSLDGNNRWLHLLLSSEVSGHNHSRGRTAIGTNQVSQHCTIESELYTKARIDLLVACVF